MDSGGWGQLRCRTTGTESTFIHAVGLSPFPTWTRESSGCPVEDLTYGQALLTEAKFAQWLKNEGYPAYFA